MEQNGIEQALTLRRYYLPGEGDDEQNLARAMWLEKRERKRMEVAVQNAIANLFNRK
ncbi:DUF6890 family protein [Vibrio hepatarius]|uniref:DUF6890 family protein n=1 Tax=Vibrio hepatarius TaxID=171383 RepID=UPI003F512FB2